MSNIVSHPRFDRPPVHQPHPRLRRGTSRFRQFVLTAKSDDGFARRHAPGWFARYRSEEMRVEQTLMKRAVHRTFSESIGADLGGAPLYPQVPADALDRVLKAGGLCRGVSLVTGCCIIMRDDEKGPPPAA